MAQQLRELGFQQFKSDASLFRSPERDIDVSVHVDDPIISGRDRQVVEKFLAELESRVLFKRAPILEPSGEPVVYRGRSYTRDFTSISVTPVPGYIAKTLQACGMANCNGVQTPGMSGSKPPLEEDPPLDPAEHKSFRSTLGRLMFLAGERGDIQFCLKELARSMSAPRASDQLALKRLLRHLRATEGFGSKLSLPPRTAQHLGSLR